MSSQLVEQVRHAGVVGAGGAGFPTHAKIGAKADVVLANGAECEPLLHTDQVILERHPREVLEGLRLVVQATGASLGILVTKKVYAHTVAVLQQHLPAFPEIRLELLDNFYPAGDEQVLLYEATGRITPEGGIPIQVGAVVSNVGTLANVAAAAQGEPVVRRYVTMVGEVARPGVYEVPVGTQFRDLLAFAGGTSLPEFAILAGGPMMGSLAADEDEPVTKTSGGFFVLRKDHPLIASRQVKAETDIKRSMSACCQCRMCTDLCPRNNLGHRIEPHLWMRAVKYGQDLSADQITQAHLCCLCGVCEVYSCPQGLSPRRVAAELKSRMWKAKIANPFRNRPDAVNPERGYRKVAKHRLLHRLGLVPYDVEMPFRGTFDDVDRVVLKLKQHVGAPASALVAVGDNVTVGQRIADMRDGALGAPIHASISGRVAKVDDRAIVIRRV